MSKETPRRSMVGAPPSMHASGRGGSSSKLVLKVARKRKVEEDPVEESADSSDEKEDKEAISDEERDTKGVSKKKKKRKLMDKGVKAKRRAEKRIEEKKKKEVREREAEKEEEEEIEEEEEPEEEPEPVMKKASLTQYDSKQLLFDHLLRRLMEKDKEEYFHFPVTASIAPDYNTIIKQPMDLQTMREKIEQKEYATIQQFKADGKLIVTNALTYNAPQTVYNVAAQRLSQVIDYYCSENYLRDCAQKLPFAQLIDWEEIGLRPLDKMTEERPKPSPFVDDLTADDILKSIEDAKVKTKLATRLPNAPKLAFIDNRNGATVLSVLGEKDTGRARIIDVVGRLDEGTPGVFAPSDTKLIGQSAVAYLNYGPFCSFAPQFDSTWATMSKRDSDLLLRTYGEKTTAVDALSLRAMMADTGEHFTKVVDEILDRLTDGEHTKTLKALDKTTPPIKEEPLTDIESALAEIESLANLGFDVSFVHDVRRSMNATHETRAPDARLAQNARNLNDLARLQHERLSAPPPLPLTKAAMANEREQKLAVTTAGHLAATMAEVRPQDIVSAPALHDSMGMNNDLDMDILSEFFDV